MGSGMFAQDTLTLQHESNTTTETNCSRHAESAAASWQVTPATRWKRPELTAQPAGIDPPYLQLSLYIVFTVFAAYKVLTGGANI